MLLKIDSTDSVSQFITLLLIFVFVLGLTYFTTYFIANYQKGRVTGSNITLLEATRIGNNKFLQLVKIGKKYYCLAVCKDSVTVVACVEEDELNLSESGGRSFDFSKILERMRGGGTGSGSVTEDMDFSSDSSLEKLESGDEVIGSEEDITDNRDNSDN